MTVFSPKLWNNGAGVYMSVWGFSGTMKYKLEIDSHFIDSLFISHTRGNQEHYCIC